MSPRRKAKLNYRLINRPLKKGEFIYFRRLNGKPSNFDRKRKLFVEVWNDKGRVGYKNRADKKGNPIPSRVTARQKSFYYLREAPHFKKHVDVRTASLDFELDSRDFISRQLSEIGIVESLIELAERKGIITVSFLIKVPKTGEQFERTPELVINETDENSMNFLEDQITSLILSVLFKYSKRISAKKYAPKYRHKYTKLNKIKVEVRVKAA